MHFDNKNKQLYLGDLVKIKGTFNVSDNNNKFYDLGGQELVFQVKEIPKEVNLKITIFPLNKKDISFKFDTENGFFINSRKTIKIIK